MEYYFDRSLTGEREKMPALSGLALKFEATSRQGNIWLGYGVVICYRLVLGRLTSVEIIETMTHIGVIMYTKSLQLDRCAAGRVQGKMC